MENRKSIQYKIDKTTTVVLFVLYLVAQICCFLFERDVWGFLTGVRNPKMLSLVWTLLISLGLSIVYIAIFSLRTKYISNVLLVKCDPMQFYERFGSFAIRVNTNAQIQNKMSCNFFAGNWDITREQCFDVLTHSKHIPHILDAYSIMAQIYLVEGDVVNITALRDSVKPFMADVKFGQYFTKIYETADMYFDYMMGDAEKMLEKYKQMLEVTKQPANRYLIKFYLALALARTGDAEKAITIFEEIIRDANKLFVVQRSKDILLSLALS